jgi:hypothetical protein
MGQAYRENIELANSVEWYAPLGQCMVFNIGNPSFNAKAGGGLNLGLSMSSNIKFELCWSFDLTLGFAKTGFFLDMTRPDEITYVHSRLRLVMVGKQS